MLHVALTLDHNYVLPVSVLITSILKNLNSSCNITFHLIVSKFSNTDKEIICKLKSIKDFEVVYYEAEKYADLFSRVDVCKFRNQYINIVCYYRLLLFKIIPLEVKKIFYIDGDMIVNTDLSRIYEVVDNNLAALVVETVAMTYRDTGLKHLHEYPEFSNFSKSPMDYPYYNAGFELLNLEKIREYNLWDEAWKFFDAHPNPPYADQDIINAIIGQAHRSEVYILGPEYNVFCTNNINHEYGHDDAFYPRISTVNAYQNPKILHYAGPDKPWINGNSCYYDVWWNYARMTPLLIELLKLSENALLQLTNNMNLAIKTNQTPNVIETMSYGQAEWTRKSCILKFLNLTFTRSEKVRVEYEKYLAMQPPRKPGNLHALLSYVDKLKTLVLLNLRKEEL